MSTFDIILLLFLAFGALKGYLNGFIVEICSFLAFFVGLFLALELTIPVSYRLFGGSSFSDIIAIVVFIGLFILITFLIRIGAKSLKKAINVTFLGVLDSILGVFVGLLKWAFLVSIIFWVVESVGFDLGSRYTDDSVIFPYIVTIGPKVFGWLGQVTPFVKDLIDSMESLPKTNDAYTTL